MFQHSRDHYRVCYPPTARPVFVSRADQRSYPVVDCSEKGFRFGPLAVEESELPSIGDAVRGHINFRSGQTVHVSGVVVRIQAAEVAVHLTDQVIPFGVMIQEQVYLRRRYPFFYAQS